MTYLEEWIAQKNIEIELGISNLKKSKRAVTLRVSEEDHAFLSRVAADRGYSRTALAEKIVALSIVDARAIWEKEEA